MGGSPSGHPRRDPTGPGSTAWALRLAGGVILAAGTASLLLARVAAGPDIRLDGRAMWLVVVLAIGLCLAALAVPWTALPRGSSLAVPVAALGLLLLVDHLSRFTTGPGAAAAYPVYLLLVLTWVGVTQPRTTALTFSLCAGAVLAYVLLRHDDAALPVASLAVILPVGVTLGETAAWLVARGRLLDHREERRAGDLQRLTRLLAGLATGDDLGAAARLVAREAAELFGCPAATVELRAGDGLVARAEHGSAPGSRRTISLVGSSRVVGTVDLAPGGAPFDGYFRGLADLFALQVGTTVEQLRLITELDREARLDALTGTGNRRHAAELLDSLRTGDAVLVVDLDHFKSVNDTWGHRAGDEELHRLGGYLQSCMRSSDDVARFGGDEFVVVARAAGRDVQATAERVRRGWHDQGNRTTVSIGAALHRGGRGDETLDRADAALYRAKWRGRDQIVVAED